MGISQAGATTPLPLRGKLCSLSCPTSIPVLRTVPDTSQKNTRWINSWEKESMNRWTKLDLDPKLGDLKSQLNRTTTLAMWSQSSYLNTLGFILLSYKWVVRLSDLKSPSNTIPTAFLEILHMGEEGRDGDITIEKIDPNSRKNQKEEWYRKGRINTYRGPECFHISLHSVLSKYYRPLYRRK